MNPNKLVQLSSLALGCMNEEQDGDSQFENGDRFMLLLKNFALIRWVYKLTSKTEFQHELGEDLFAIKIIQDALHLYTISESPVDHCFEAKDLHLKSQSKLRQIMLSEAGNNFPLES